MIVCKMRKACRTDGFFFTKADEWSDAVRTRRKSDARPRPRLPYFRSNSPPPFLLFLQVRPFAMKRLILTRESHTFGRWTETRTCMFGGKIRYALSLFQKEGKFESLVGGREGIAREKFCRPLERIIERACSSSDKQKGHDTFRTTTDATGFLQSSWNESTVYLHRIVECARFPIFNGGRVASSTSSLSLSLSRTVHCFLYMEMPRNRIRSRWLSLGMVSSFTFDFEKYVRRLIYK